MLHVTMVKKRLANGQDCRKCVQAEALLKDRGLWGRIDRIVWADESDHESEGMHLGRRHGIDTAPFFIVQNGHAQPAVFQSTLRLVKELVPDSAPQTELLGEEEVAALQRELVSRPPQAALEWALSRFGHRP